MDHKKEMVVGVLMMLVSDEFFGPPSSCFAGLIYGTND